MTYNMNCNDTECGLNSNGECSSLSWASICDCSAYLDWEKDQDYGDEYE